MIHRDRSVGFTLIELLATVAIVGALIALLLPAVQAAREAARRAQCANNLKQLALAAHGYHDAAGCFPIGAYYPSSSLLNANSGPYTFALLPYLELGAVYHAINFDVATDFLVNETVLGVGISTLWCPSDPVVSEPVDLNLVLYDAPTKPVLTRYCSYGGNCGTWYSFPSNGEKTQAKQVRAMNGVIYQGSSVRIGAVRDGASTTILFGETAHGMGTPPRRDRWHWWSSSVGTQITAMWPPNPQRSVRDAIGPGSSSNGTVYRLAASSFHPGGAQFAFCDGSVRFLKDTIESWPIDSLTSLPVGVACNPVTNLFSLTPAARPGVFQALSTRNGGEVMSTEAY